MNNLPFWRRNDGLVKGGDGGDGPDWSKGLGELPLIWLLINIIDKGGGGGGGTPHPGSTGGGGGGGIGDEPSLFWKKKEKKNSEC